MLEIIGLALAAYLIGSIPIGFIAGKAGGVDLRTIGSGNYGATNVYRAFGLKLALLVFVLDVAKGFVGTRVLPLLWEADISMEWLRLVCGISVIAGSVASIFMKFRGGKGVANSVGVFLGLTPAATGICLAVWGALFARFRYVSLGSITGAICLPILTAVLAEEPRFTRDPVFYLALVVAVIVIARHRANIKRLLKGTENRIGGTRGQHAR
jgi:glycerol-3-phosphate acyltransferase PlsY